MTAGAHQPPTRVGESFLRALGASAFWGGLERMAGLGKHVLIAAAIGLSVQLDVFYMAVALLSVLVFSWANLLDVLAVPRLVRAWREGDHTTFQALAGGLLLLCALASLALALALVAARDWIALLAAGFDTERRALLADALLWLAPAALLYVPLRMLGAVARAVRRFTPFYQAEFLIALVVLICVAVSRDPHVLFWSFGLGVATAFFFCWSACAACSVPGATHSTRWCAPVWRWRPAC